MTPRASISSRSSGLSSCSTDTDSHVSVNAATWGRLRTKANTRFGKQSERPAASTEYASVKIDGSGILKATSDCYRSQRNVLSKLQWEHLQSLRKGDKEHRGTLRLRHGPKLCGKPHEKYWEEFEITEADREIDLVQKRTRTFKGRKPLTHKLGLSSKTCDQYALFSEVKGAQSGLYQAASSDQKLEEAVYNISARVYGAQPGILRMPVKRPAKKFAKDRPAMLSRKQSTDEILPWGINDPLTATTETTTSRYPVALHAPKRDGTELVQQEIYRADSKRFGIADRPIQVGDYYIQRETLQPHGNGMLLNHIDKRIYGEVKPEKHIKKQKKGSGKRCVPFGAE